MKNTAITAYVARDKDGFLGLYLTEKPIKEESMEFWINSNSADGGAIDDKGFEDVKWEDDEPVEVELIVKRK